MMKKRTLRSVFDGLRSSVAQQPKNEHEEIVESLRSENFQLVKVGKTYIFKFLLTNCIDVSVHEK